MGLRAKFLRVVDVGGLPPTFWWLWAGTLVNRAGAFVIPFLSYYLTQSQGHSAAFAGFVAALNAVGAAISAVVGGVLADRIGRRPTLLGANIGSAAMVVALGLVHSVPLIAAFSFLVGLTNNASRPASSAMIADLVAPADRTRAYSLNFWGVNLGFAVAMIVAGVAAAHSYLLLFFGDAGTTLACAILIFWKVPETRHPAQARAADSAADAAGGTAPAGSLLDVLRDRIYLAFLGAMLVGAVIYQQANATQPVSAGRDGLGPGAYGVTAALNGLIIVSLQLPLTKWLRRFSPGRVLAGATLLMGGGFAIPLLVGAAGHAFAFYIASCVVWTIGEIGSTPTMLALVADLSPAHLRGRYQGMYNLAWSVAGMVGPLLGGWALSVSGSAAVWWTSLGLGLVSVPGWLVLDRRAAARAAANREREAALTAAVQETSPAAEAAAVPTPGGAVATGCAAAPKPVSAAVG